MFVYKMNSSYFRIFVLLFLLLLLNPIDCIGEEAERSNNAAVLLDYFMPTASKLGRDYFTKLIGSPFNDLNTESGLYLIVYVTETVTIDNLLNAKVDDIKKELSKLTKSEILPMYIGMTDNLKTRLLQHATESSTQNSNFMYKWEITTCERCNPRLRISGGSVINSDQKHRVYVLYKKMHYINAKWLESIFLNVFDFAFNKLEQEKTSERRELLIDKVDSFNGNAELSDAIKTRIDQLQTEITSYASGKKRKMIL